MNLLDALCSSPNARSIVELSLSPHFPREHTTLYKVIKKPDWKDILPSALIGKYVCQPKTYSFWLLALDGTPQRRQFSYSLEDRGYVHYPNQVAGNKPVTIGHEYSTVVLLPEKRPKQSASWVIPLSVERISTDADTELVGAVQLISILDDTEQPWYGELIVDVGDSRYSKPEYLHATHKNHPNLISVIRARSNRTFYHYIKPS